jgi:xylulokinase
MTRENIGHVLTLDLGSSGLRAVVVSPEYRIVSEVKRPYHIYRSSGHAEHFTPADLRRRVLDCLASAVRAATVAPNAISRISITAQRGGTAFLDAHGATLYAGPNTDVRAVFEGAAIDDQLAAEVYAITGHLPSMFLAPAKLHWWHAHQPRRARRIATVASLGSWAAHQLTGDLGETPSTLVEAGLANVTTGHPAVALLARLGVSLDALPNVVSEGAVVGTLGRESADTMGLRIGTPVALAGPDAQITALGAGSVRPGDTTVIAGWSAPVQRVTAIPTFDAARRTWAGRHAVDSCWILEANPGDTGRTLETVRRMLGPRMSLERFDRLAAGAPERELPIVAAWGPRALDMSNPGMSLGGLIAPSPITYEGIDAGAVARATLENIAFAIRECLALLDEVAGGSAGGYALTLTGGMANSSTFASVLAAAVGRPVRVQSPRAAAIGAALVSTLAASDIGAAADQIASQAVDVTPSHTGARDATERYERWLHVRRALDQLAVGL